jgi:anti-sigma regulatory factor (Ser/Thr protein kinase)
MVDLLTCPAETSSVRAARQFVVDKLQEWRCDELVDSAALMTSELATNAVVHTGMPYTVCIERQARGIRVEVADRVRELPPRPDGIAPLGDDPDARPGDASVDPSHLFSGLRVVDAVATSWGSEQIPGDGKVVWFELVSGRSDGGEDRLADLRDSRTSPAEDVADDPWDVLVPRSDEDELALIGDGSGAHPMRWLLVSLAVVALVLTTVALVSRDGSALGVVWYGH